MKTKLFALILVLVLMLLSLVPAVHAEDWTREDIHLNAFRAMYLMIVHDPDIDNDGKADVVATSSVALGSVYWYNASDPTGTWDINYIDQGGLGGAWDVFAYKIDNDNDPDVVAAGRVDDIFVWYECPTDPTQTNWPKRTIDSDNTTRTDGACSVYVAHDPDIDNDGNPDVVAAAYGNNTVVWYEAPDDPTLAGATWTPHIIDSTFSHVEEVHVADIDNDNDPDVVAAAIAPTNQVVWYECPTDPTQTPWTKHTIDPSLGGAVSVDVAYIDNDNYLDVVATGLTDDVVVWYECPDNPAQTQTPWTKRYIDSSLNGARGVCVYSIDGWSTLDVVVAAQYADEVVWYQGPEDPKAAEATWTKTTIEALAANSQPVGVDVYRIDGDLDPDVVASIYMVNDVVWYEAVWPVWPIPEVPLGTILLLGTGLLIPVAIAAAKWLRLNHRLSK